MSCRNNSSGFERATLGTLTRKMMDGEPPPQYSPPESKVAITVHLRESQPVPEQMESALANMKARLNAVRNKRHDQTLEDVVQSPKREGAWGGGKDKNGVELQGSAAMRKIHSAILVDPADNNASGWDKSDTMDKFRTATGFHRSASQMMYLQHAPVETTGIVYWQYQVALFMENNWVKLVLLLIICANGLMMGIQTDFGSGDPMWLIIEGVFLIIFMIELCLNLFGFGRLFFYDGWNWLDFIVVISSIIDMTMALTVEASGDGGGGGASVMRLGRIFRVVVRSSRILKLMKFGEKLVLLVETFVVGLGSASYVGLLMFLVVYIFAVLGRELFATDELQQCLTARQEANPDSFPEVDVFLYFGSIPRCFVTLMQLFVTDTNVEGVQRPIQECWPLSCLYFMAYFVIVTVSLMELLTCVFVDALLVEKAKAEGMEKTSGKEKGDELREELISLVEGIFRTFDVDNSDILEEDEIEMVRDFARTEEMATMLNLIQMDPITLDKALVMADANLDGNVTRQELLASLACLADPGQSQQHENVNNLERRLARVEKTTEKKMDDVTQRQQWETQSITEMWHAVACFNLEMEAFVSGASSANPEAVKIFKEIDYNNNGSITLEEVKAALHRRGIPASDAVKLMNQLDTDGDERITMKEFLDRYGVWLNFQREHVRKTAQPTAVLEQDPRKIFQELDVDRNGFLDVEELGVALKQKGVSFDDASALMAQLDIDKDNRVTQEEFVDRYGSWQYMLHVTNSPELRSAEHSSGVGVLSSGFGATDAVSAATTEAMRVFHELDIDGDGSLSVKELRTGLKFKGHDRSAADRLIERLDVDGDGRVTADEFVARYAAWQFALNRSQQQQQQSGGLLTIVGGSGEVSIQDQDAVNLFNELDRNGDGELDRHELEIALKLRGLGGEQAKQLMTTLDVNGDGLVSREEFCYRFGAWQYLQLQFAQGANGREEAKKMFRELDANQDGELEVDELRVALRLKGLNKNEAQKLLEQMDVNGDGHVSESEFCQRYSVWKNAQQKPQKTGVVGLLSSDPIDALQKEAISIFNEMDVDGDGTLAELELRIGLKMKGIPVDQSSRLMMDLDTDGDGVVTQQEFVDKFGAWKFALEQVQKIQDEDAAAAKGGGGLLGFFGW